VLAVAVVATTVAGFSALTDLFDPAERGVMVGTPYGAAGAILTCGDEARGQICRIDDEALARGATSDDFVQLTNFTDGLTVGSPSVSPDGTTVVFERQEPGAQTTPSDSVALWTIGTDGKGLRQRTSCCVTDPSWSPEGLIVAVADEGGPDGTGPAELAILDPSATADPVIETIELPGLTFPSAPSFSPDGTQILFAAGSDPNSAETDVFTIDIHDSNLTNLTRTPRSEWTPAWSPDGQRIAFGVATSSGEELFTCPLDCSNPRRLEDPSGGAIYGALPTWSPDGNWIAFTVETRPGSDLHVARIDGSEERTLLDGFGEIAWIPAHETNSAEPSVGPDPSASPEPEGLDIGLGFNVCNAEQLGGIDFLGDGADGKAWTATRVSDGTCPTEADGDNLVAVDLDADGSADDWAPLPFCTFCEPTGTVDLDRDGVAELVVLMQGGTVANYTLYSVDGPVGNRLRPILIWEYSGLPDFPSGEQVSLLAGGDEGFSSSIDCVETPERTYLVSTRLTVPVDDPDPATFSWSKTRLVLQADGTLKVWDYESLGPDPNGPPSIEHVASACGLSLDPSASQDVG
jgi:hypothetical protein